MDGDLLAAIQKGKGLKKVPKPVESSPARVGGGGGGGGGGGARAGAPASFAPPPATGGGMMAEMQRKMQARQAGGGIGGPTSATSFSNKPVSQFNKPAATPVNQFNKPTAAPANQFNKPVNQFNKPAAPAANQFNKPAAPAANQFNKPAAPAANQFNKPVNQFNKPTAPANQFNKPAAVGMGKPKPVVIPVAPKPAANSGPVDLAKYIKLQKAGLPQGAVEHAMRKDGVDPDLLFGAGAQQQAAAPTAVAEPTPQARPASQRAAPPRPTSQRAAPPPPPRAGATGAPPPPRNVAAAPPPPTRITSVPPPPARAGNTGVASKPPPPAIPKAAGAKPAPPPAAASRVGAGFVPPPRQPQQQQSPQPVSLPSSSKPVYTPPTAAPKAFAAAPAPPAKLSGNVDLSKYVKLQKAGLPQGAVEHAMRKDGVDPDLLFGAGAPAPAAAKPAAPPPPARIASVQRAPPPPVTTTELKQHAPPPPTASATTQDTGKNISKSFSKMGTVITGAFTRKQSVTTPGGGGVEAHSSMDMANDDPNLVPTLITWLQSQPRITTVENLTRESRPEAKKLLNDVNRMGSVPASVNGDVHVVAAALKEHFKSMPGACICGDYATLVSLGNSIGDDGDLAAQLSQRVRGIADLKLLFGFLSSLRGVTQNDLAYTWAPHVLRPKEVSMDSLTRDSKTVNRIVLIMLQRYAQVFGDSGFAVAAPSAAGEDASRPPQFRLPLRIGGAPPQRNNAAGAPPPPPRTDGRAAPPPPPPAGGFRLPPPTRNMAQ